MTNAPFKWSSFFKEYVTGVAGFLLIAAPVYYFFGDEIAAFLRASFG